MPTRVTTGKSRSTSTQQRTTAAQVSNPVMTFNCCFKGFGMEDFVVHALASLGVRHVFGIAGIPITALADALPHRDIQFIAMRNEQQASYAASIYGYLNELPGICLTVGGPGVVHALAGLVNAKENRFPMVLIAGASDSHLETCGAFQEWSQLESVKPYCKLAVRVRYPETLPDLMRRVVEASLSGTPGPCYLELSSDFLRLQPPAIEIPPVLLTRIQEPHPCQDEINRVANLISTSSQPILLVGKGAVRSLASTTILEDFLRRYPIPYIAAPMAKGLIPDTHDLNATPARSYAFNQSDIVIVLGTRINWQWHFGTRWKRACAVVHVSIETSDLVPLTQNNADYIGIHSGCRAFLEDLLTSSPAKNQWAEWIQDIRTRVQSNREKVETLCQDSRVPLSYYAALSTLRPYMSSSVLVSEGANTMDISRVVFDHTRPKSRLDAGTFGTMGVGTAYAIAAHLSYPNRRIICLQARSGMEIETMVRYGFPITIVVINNNGIYSGLTEEAFNCRRPFELPSTALTPNSRYDEMMRALGGSGFYVKTKEQLQNALKECMEVDSTGPKLINVMINPVAERGQTTHNDQYTTSKL